MTYQAMHSPHLETLRTLCNQGAAHATFDAVHAIPFIAARAGSRTPQSIGYFLYITRTYAGGPTGLCGGCGCWLE